MKTWQKKISAFLVILVIASAILIFFSDQKECCLCSCFRYHEPCLIDLKTGELLNLSLYMDHPTLVAELDLLYGIFLSKAMILLIPLMIIDSSMGDFPSFLAFDALQTKLSVIML